MYHTGKHAPTFLEHVADIIFGMSVYLHPCVYPALRPLTAGIGSSTPHDPEVWVAITTTSSRSCEDGSSATSSFVLPCTLISLVL